MPRVVHFEFAATDPDRAARFWREAFGWEITKWEGPAPYWLVKTGEGSPGIDGGIMSGPGGPFEGAGTICTLDVESLDASTDKVQELGGEVVAPKMAVPGVGWLAYCRDTEGILFGLMQPDESAA
jgi:predicted enzyme related to lactoylglutathione lyase